MIDLEEQLQLQKCPHCKIDSPSLKEYTRFSTTSYNDTNFRIWGIYICSRCGGIIAAAADSWHDVVKEIYPQSKIISEDIPEPARSYLIQAIDSLHAPSGAIMLAASSIDSMLKIKGLYDGDLFSRIKMAATKMLITPEMAKWAHEVRLDANEQRHADINSELPIISEAEKTVEFAQAFAEYLFVLPARIQRGLSK